MSKKQKSYSADFKQNAVSRMAQAKTITGSTLRQCTHTGRPLGTREFIGSLEHELHRNLAAQKRGRPRKVAAEDNQCTLVFEY